jgi:CheY-like chemotaxis protein
MPLNLQHGLGVATRRIRVRPVVKPTILIAEDSADSREMLRLLLQLKGYEVLSVEDGPHAVELALARRPDMILLDLELPKLDGLGVTRHLRSHREFKNTPIVIVSGHDPRQFRKPALDAGCTEYILKPIDFERLDTLLLRNVPLSR